jgi:hypothetical protein
MFVKQLLSTILFLSVLIAGAFGPHSLTLCEPVATPALGDGSLVAGAQSPTAPGLAFALTNGVLLADRETMTRTAFWSLPCVQALAWTPDGSLLLALDVRGALHAIDPVVRRERWAVAEAASGATAWRFRPALGLVALVTPTSGLRVFRLSDGAVVNDPGLTSAAFWVD